MNLPLFMARRYLFSKKSHSAINIISAISAGGIAIATMAMVCVLSVFNGFRDLIGGLYSTFDAPIEVSAAKGKFMDADAVRMAGLQEIPGVEAVSASLEENALILFKGNPVVVRVKGVDSAFHSVTGIDSIVYNTDNVPQPLPPLSAAEVQYAVPGYGLASRMGMNFGQIQICAPRRGERINMANPVESFNVNDVFSTGLYFRVSQKRYDENYLLTSLTFAQNLFEQPGRISAVALRPAPGADAEEIMEGVRRTLGPDYKVRSREEQHEDTFRVMKIEKLMAYSFLTFILLIACFNLIGSVAMLIIDKRDNMATLRHLGLSHRDAARVFLLESRLITLLGGVAGILLGLLLCWLQQTFGFISLGGSGANFIVDAYPVSVHLIDVLLVFVTVVAVGFLTVWYPVRYLTRRML